METTIEIKKADIYDEVAKLTSYIGAKTIEDSGLTYDRVFTTDDDREMLERFWRDSVTLFTNNCRRFVKSVTIPTISQTINMSEVCTIVLDMPSNFNIDSRSLIENYFRSFCINAITAKWLSITNKGEAQYYFTEAETNIEQTNNTMYHRMKPKRMVI